MSKEVYFKEDTGQESNFSQNILLSRSVKAIVNKDYDELTNSTELNRSGSIGFEIGDLSTPMSADTAVNVLFQSNLTPLSSVMTLLSPNSIAHAQQAEDEDIGSAICCVEERVEAQSDIESDSESEEDDDDDDEENNPMDSNIIDSVSGLNNELSVSYFSDNRTGPLNLVKFSTLSPTPNFVAWNWDTSSPENITTTLYSTPTTSQICVPDNSIFSPHFFKVRTESK